MVGLLVQNQTFPRKEGGHASLFPDGWDLCYQPREGWDFLFLGTMMTASKSTTEAGGWFVDKDRHVSRLFIQ